MKDQSIRSITVGTETIWNLEKLTKPKLLEVITTLNSERFNLINEISATRKELYKAEGRTVEDLLGITELREQVTNLRSELDDLKREVLYIKEYRLDEIKRELNSKVTKEGYDW